MIDHQYEEGKGPSLTIPAPTACQSLVYESEDEDVVLLLTDHGRTSVLLFTPDQARDLGNRLIDCADEIDGGEGDACEVRIDGNEGGTWRL